MDSVFFCLNSKQRPAVTQAAIGLYAFVFSKRLANVAHMHRLNLLILLHTKQNLASKWRRCAAASQNSLFTHYFTIEFEQNHLSGRPGYMRTKAGWLCTSR